jgi:hypothetical protein
MMPVRYARCALVVAASLAMSCGGDAGGADSAKPNDSAKPSAKSAAQPSGKPSASGAPATSASGAPASAPPTPESFGPNVTKDVIEAVNASDAYDTNTPAFAVDGKPTTSWSARPTGAWFEVGLLPGTRVDGIELGGQRTGKNSKGAERWDVNGVMKKVAVEWDGGKGELTFDRATDKGVRKKLGIGAVTRKLRISVLEVDKGTESDDVDIDELAIFGTKGPTKAPDKTGLTSLCKADAVAVRFKDGAVYGGEWMPSKDTPERAIRWDFTPTSVRVDDGEWHTLGLKYVDNASVDESGTRVPGDVKALGRIFRFRLSGETFESEIEGKPASGKCGVTMTGAQ